MKIIIEKNGDVKAMAKLKDFVSMLSEMFPGQIDIREVIQIETSSRSLFELLNAYGKTPKPALICPRCGNMVKVLSKMGICKPCMMVEARAKKRDEAAEARRNLDADLLDIDNHPLAAVKVG